MTTKTETETEQDQATDEPQTITAYLVRHHDGRLLKNALHERLENIIADEADRYCVDLYFNRDVACAVRLEKGWTDDADIIPVQIPARAPGAEQTTGDLIDRLVKMRHITCLLGAEVEAMKLRGCKEWREASDALAEADGGLLALEESLLEAAKTIVDAKA